MLNLHCFRRSGACGLLVLAATLLVSVQPAMAQSAYAEIQLYNFTGQSDGNSPWAGVIFDSQGNLYGTTQYGGATNSGVVYKLSPPSGGSGPWTETLLHTFMGTGDGQNPFFAGLILDVKGNLYGTTVNGPGVAFQLSPPSSGTGPWTETVLHTFGGGSDGGAPYSGVIIDVQGNLYGTALFGGDLTQCSGAGCGVVFKLSPPGVGNASWTETVLYTFSGGSSGAGPVGGLVFDSQGNLYGTTRGGGNAACSCGVVFELSPPGGGTGPWSETVLYAFSGNDGYSPYGNLVFDSAGKIYGTTVYGGVPSTCSLLQGAPPSPGCGVVFELSPPASGPGAWTETVLHYFADGGQGANPYAGLTLDSKGNLFGTTDIGTSGGAGVVFELSPPNGAGGAWSYSVLFDFCETSMGTGQGLPCNTGAGPTAGVIFDSRGNLYGTTGGGGTTGFDSGEVFELSPAAAAPVFSLPPGSYDIGQMVTISDATPGAAIYYTTDGSTPSASSTPYGGPITLDSTETIRAIAVAGGLLPSAVTSAAYFILPAAPPPVIGPPPPGTYTSPQMVSILNEAPGSTIYYTTNGSTPTTLSPQYNGPISVNSTETISAIAAGGGYSPSTVASATYTIHLPSAATPIFSPAPGTYTSVQSVTITDSTPGTTIYYAINATPTKASTAYTGPVSVSATETLEAIAVATGFSQSAVATAAYTINLPAPDFQVSVSPSTLTIIAGQSGTATFTMTPENGFNSQVSFACGGLPAESACSFSPSSVTPNGSAVSTTLNVTTTAASAALRKPLPPSQSPSYAFLFVVLAMIFSIAARRRRPLRALQLLDLLILLMVASGLTSCSKGSVSVGNPGTPVGNSVVSVSASTSGGGGINHAAALTITITH